MLAGVIVRTSLLVVATAALLACGPHERAGEQPGAPVCNVVVGAPNVDADASTPTPAPPPPTRAVAHLTLPFATMAGELEAKIPKRLVDEKDRDIGIAGRLEIAVDRGPLAVTAEGESLLVRAPLHARAQACAKGRCYASCDPEAVATVTVSLRLTPAFTFAPSHADVAITRGCVVAALGGMLRIDVTPMVAEAARGELRRVEREVDARLPRLRPQAEHAWRALETPQKLPIACVQANPVGLVQGPVTSAPGAVRLRFALLASPEIRPACGPPPPPRPLPPLAFDPALPTDDDLDLLLVQPLATSALVRGASCDADVHATGAAPAWSADGRTLALGAVTLAAEDRAHVREPGPAELEARAAKEARIVPLLTPEGLRDALPALAASFADPQTDVTARVVSVRGTTAAVRGPDLAATIRLHGSVEVRPK